MAAEDVPLLVSVISQYSVDGKPRMEAGNDKKSSVISPLSSLISHGWDGLAATSATVWILRAWSASSNE